MQIEPFNILGHNNNVSFHLDIHQKISVYVFQTAVVGLSLSFFLFNRFASFYLLNLKTK